MAQSSRLQAVAGGALALALLLLLGLRYLARTAQEVRWGLVRPRDAQPPGGCSRAELRGQVPVLCMLDSRCCRCCLRRCCWNQQQAWPFTVCDCESKGSADHACTGGGNGGLHQPTVIKHPGSSAEHPPCFHPISVCCSQDTQTHYAVYIDAGSSGTRVHVFAYTLSTWPSYVQLQLPEKVHSTEPGLSSYAGRPQQGAASLQPLLDYAYEQVPEHLWQVTPVHLLATAGLRLLSAEDAAAILHECTSFLASSK